MSGNSIGKLVVIGAGAMGAAFTKGVLAAGLFDASQVTLVDLDASKLDQLASNYGVRTSQDAKSSVKDADVVLIAVKPGIVEPVLKGISQSLSDNQLVISIAAGVKLGSIEKNLPPTIGAIRAMPNTPCRIGAGAIGFSRGASVKDEQVEIAKRIFDAVGLSYEVPETLLDAVTGLSGSGPAYVFMMIEALSDAGVRVGIPRDISLKLSAQTVYGAAKIVLEENEHPARLKDQVTSPGGTTIAGIDALEQAGLRSALIEAVKAATKRSKELG